MGKRVALAGAIAVLFGITVLVLSRILPGPYRPADYLVMGALATFVCILAVFLANLFTPGRNGDIFYKRRK